MTADERAAAVLKHWREQSIYTDTMLLILVRDAIRDAEREVLEDAARGLISREQAAEIRARIDATSHNIEVFLRRLGIEDLSELPLARFDEVMDMLK